MGNMSFKGPSRFDGEMRVKQNPTKIFDINVVMENAILDGFGIEPKAKIFQIGEPLEVSLYVLSHDIEADFPKDLSAILAPKRDFENIQLDNFENIASLLINRLEGSRENQVNNQTIQSE